MFSFHENSLAGAYPPDPHPTVARRDHGARSAGQDHRMAHAGHTATANRSAVPSAPPPRFRGSIVRREDVEFLGRKPETGGTPTPPGLSSGVTGDSTTLNSAKPPPKRPEWPVRAFFLARQSVGGSMTWTAATQSAKNPPTGGASSSCRSRARLPAGGPSRITSTGSSATTGLRSAVAPATGLGGWSTSPPAAPAAGQKTVGSEGARPPASLRRGRTECGHKEYAGLSPIVMQIPA